MKEEKEEVVVKEKEFHKFVHEIKNPLAICNGYLEMMLKENNNPYLLIIQREVQRSLNIITEYSKNQFSAFHVEEFDLTCLLEDVIETFNLLFLKTNHKIFFVEEEEYYMMGDYDHLKRVFLNLLKNAYEAAEEVPLLVVVRIVPYSYYYQVYITDNGVGMTKEERRRVGEEYFTTKQNGTGLGISYCLDVIRHHGGDLFYQSRKKIGTRVIVTLPKEKSPETFNRNNYCLNN